ncbi:hypothetical protein FACS1894151_00760 [Spirochaetia bacterium]|nr:hypothetical protein FACS1894151_00760 [Spirochaetia bacterium]GHV95060.1 hypothetical protein AGMMS50293_13800 [Spirochaetia bacterium]
MSDRTFHFDCPSCGPFDVYAEGVTLFEDISCPGCGKITGQIPARLAPDLRNVDIFKTRAEHRFLCDDFEGAENDIATAIELAPGRADLCAIQKKLKERT